MSVCALAMFLAIVRGCAVLVFISQSFTEAADNRFLMSMSDPGATIDVGGVKAISNIKAPALSLDRAKEVTQFMNSTDNMNATPGLAALDSLKAGGNTSIVHAVNEPENAPNLTKNFTQEEESQLVDNVPLAGRNATRGDKSQRVDNAFLADGNSQTEQLLVVSDADEKDGLDSGNIDSAKVSVFHVVLFSVLCLALDIVLVSAFRRAGYCSCATSSFHELANDPRTPKRLGRSQSRGEHVEVGP